MPPTADQVLFSSEKTTTWVIGTDLAEWQIRGLVAGFVRSWVAGVVVALDATGWDVQAQVVPDEHEQDAVAVNDLVEHVVIDPGLHTWRWLGPARSMARSRCRPPSPASLIGATLGVHALNVPRSDR